MAISSGDLPTGTDAQWLGDFFTTVLNGLSVQARDGVPRARLLAVIEPALGVLPEKRAQR